MFGKRMWMERGDTKVTLAPLSLEHAATLAQHLQLLNSSLYTMMPDRSPSVWKEEDWIKRVSEDESERLWGMFVNDESEPSGTFGIGDIGHPANNASAGAMIFNTKYQSLGLGSRFIAPMIALYAFEMLTTPIFALRVQILAQNPRSWHLAEAMGGILTGISPRLYLRIDPETMESRYCDLRYYTCFNPKYVTVLYPEGLPCEYESSVEKTSSVLAEARESVRFD